MQEKISIIMPVYNASKYLHRAVDSIIRQTHRNWELICIDDGSTDSSGSICDQYAINDSRIRVMHKENAGVAAARQDGLHVATGDFIIHADSDDWMESNALEIMCANMTDCDVLITDFFSNSETETIISKKPHDCNNHSQLIRDLFVFIHANCWNKLVRAEVIRKFKPQFFPGIDFREDLLFWVQLLRHDEVRVKYLNKPFYHYFQPPTHNSLCASYSKKYAEMDRLIVRKLEEYLPLSIKDKLLLNYKLRAKHAAFEHPIYSADEYENIFPETKNSDNELAIGCVNYILFKLSYYKSLYRLCTYLYKLKNQISGHYIR